LNRLRLIIKYGLLDFVAASFAWAAFFVFRKSRIEQSTLENLQVVWDDPKFYLGIFLIPLFWVLLYIIFGMYRSVYRKSRLRELIQVLSTSIVGVLILFFAVILDDAVADYRKYYKSILVLFTLHFVITAVFRFILSTRVAHKIKNRVIGFKTLLVGSEDRAEKIYRELTEAKQSEGHFFCGLIAFNGKNIVGLPKLGELQDLQTVINEQGIEEVIIAPEEEHKEMLPQVLTQLQGLDIVIKVLPSLYQHLTGMVKMGNVFGAVLIEIETDVLPPWQKAVKRSFDLVVALLILILGLPFYMLIGALVKIGSKGPIFFRQERIGLNGKPFLIHKFRSMYIDAEMQGPQLSSEDDPRITKLGKFLRKTRIDEFPQFWNVLVGEMSIVGPRPERQFFIDQIVEKAPHYPRLHKVKPGITSWGQVKYGYAENVDEMVERMQYDLLYLENISLLLDLKILVYTVLIMLQGRGK
jgi:exopolysaccharide biosynthesis polyprenyl glycosylphosphotransferase